MGDHCCEMMARKATFDCDVCADRYECADTLIYYNEENRWYGLLVHDGGTSFIVIGYCPWCGHELPEVPDDD